MFDATIERIELDRLTKYHPTLNGNRIPFAKVVELWIDNRNFRKFFSDLLAQSPFAAYRWETPAFSERTACHPFEFVLLNSPRYATRRTDTKTYAGYFSKDDSNHGIVSFDSLSRDATLIVPCPRADSDIYGHLAAFVRGASNLQLDSLWRTVGSTMKSKLGTKPVWLNTAGGGVAWLHVRIDSHPKYTSYAPYKVFSVSHAQKTRYHSAST